MLRFFWSVLRCLQDIPLDVDAVHILNIILGRRKEFLILLLQKHILITISWFCIE